MQEVRRIQLVVVRSIVLRQQVAVKQMFMQYMVFP
jgi:hypothetical protein